MRKTSYQGTGNELRIDEFRFRHLHSNILHKRFGAAANILKTKLTLTRRFSLSDSTNLPMRFWGRGLRGSYSNRNTSGNRTGLSLSKWRRTLTDSLNPFLRRPARNKERGGYIHAPDYSEAHLLWLLTRSRSLPEH